MTTIVLVGIPAWYYLQEGIENIKVFGLFIIWIAALLFIVRGYTIDPNILYIQRLLWNTKIDLSNLKSVEFNPEAIKSSIRTFGNGGLFSFSGYFKNQELGSYRHFSTNHKNAVILHFDKKTIVISPDDPKIFVSTLNQFKNMTAYGNY